MEFFTAHEMMAGLNMLFNGAYLAVLGIKFYYEDHEGHEKIIEEVYVSILMDFKQSSR